ncbi:U-scoloptoxin(19)-Sm1a-like [Leptinotarsa decemlineata]|uniref:U-scoloptoxin(19)-Sm1a-like n=1 Tax=Leptinotarsa decemlineata TaxID=7539 RepID=UPI003D309F3F
MSKMLTLVVLFSIVFCLGGSTAKNITSNFYGEESCYKVRGFCLLEDECHQPVDEAFKNLCPNQKSEGAVCCKNFPQEQVNCYQLHHDCTEKDGCPDFLNIGKKGCPKEKICCVLI